MTRISVVSVDGVARGTPTTSIVSGMIVRPEEAQMRIVQASLMDIYDGHSDSSSRSRATVGSFHIRLTRFLERIWNPDLSELALYEHPPTLEHPKDISGRHNLPRRKWEELLKGSTRSHLLCQRASIVHDARGLPVLGVALAKQIVLIGKDAVVVGRATPKHR
jgi:hypothetical protein